MKTIWERILLDSNRPQYILMFAIKAQLEYTNTIEELNDPLTLPTAAKLLQLQEQKEISEDISDDNLETMLSLIYCKRQITLQEENG